MSSAVSARAVSRAAASTATRRPLRSWREHALVLALFLVLSIAMTWPAITLFGEAINSFGDTVVQMTTLAWNAHALGTNPFGLFEAPWFYPYAHSNAYSEHLIGETLVGLPILWLTGNPAPVANLNSLLSFVLTGWGTYLLVRDLAGNRWAALAAAIAFTFGGFRFMQSGHLHMLSTEWFPLTLWAMRRGLNRNSGRYIALAAFFFICMGLFSVYYLFFLALVVGLYLVWWLIFARNSAHEEGEIEPPRRRERGARSIWYYRLNAIFAPRWAKLIFAGIATGLILAPIYIPYFQVNQELGFSRSIYEVQNWAARWEQYLRVISSQWLWATLFPGMVSQAGERELFPGLIISLLAIVGLATGLWAAARRRLTKDPSRITHHASRIAHPDRWFYLLLGLVALVLTFGISYRLPLINKDIPLPYALLYDWVPGFTALRVPVRFAVLVDLALAVLGGYGLAWLLSLSRRTWLTLLAVPLLALMLLEYVQVRDLSNHRDVRPAQQQLYDWFADHPGPIVELPMTGNSEDVWYTYWATYHWQPLVNGFSSFVPPGTVYIAQQLKTFPDAAGLALLQGLEVKHVVVHVWEFPASQQADLKKRLAATPELSLVHQVGEDYVYELTASDWLAGPVAALQPNELLWLDAGTTQSRPALQSLAYALRYNRLARARLYDPAQQVYGDVSLGFRSLPALPPGRAPDLLLRPPNPGAESPQLQGWPQIEANAFAELYKRDPDLLARYDLTAPGSQGAPYGLPIGPQTTIGIASMGLSFDGKPLGAPLFIGGQPEATLGLLVAAFAPTSATLTTKAGATYPVSIKAGLSQYEIGGLAIGDDVKINMPEGASRPSLLLADFRAGGAAAAPTVLTYSNTLLLEATPLQPASGADTIKARVRVVPRSTDGAPFTLTLDIYQKPYGTHPDGHYGSWSVPLAAGDDGRDYEISLRPADKTVTATLNEANTEVFSWIGPPQAGDFAATLMISRGDTVVENLPLYDFSVRDGKLAEVDIKEGGTFFLPLGE